MDPVGPIGEVLSPSEVYKTRLGLPISSPHTLRAAIAAPGDIERALAPARGVSGEEAGEVPKSRVRQVSAFVEEVYAPVYAVPATNDLMALAQAAQHPALTGWKITQRQSASSKARLSAEQFMEVAQNCQIQASDEFYNGPLITVPGNDVMVIDGEVLRGTPTYDASGKMTHDGIVRGTMITRGRTEYNERTKGWAHWDKGFVKQREAALAEEASRPVRNVRRNLERVAGEVLPMRKILANPRYDRKSAC